MESEISTKTYHVDQVIICKKNDRELAIRGLSVAECCIIATKKISFMVVCTEC